jgi:hypothetical protein
LSFLGQDFDARDAEKDHVRAEGNRRRERYSDASHGPVLFVPDENSKPLEVAGFPIAEVSLFNRHASGNPPAKFRLVHESDVDVKETLLKFVLNPIHDFPSQTAIPSTGNEAVSFWARGRLLSHGRRRPSFEAARGLAS